MGKYSNIAVRKLKSHTTLAKKELDTNDFSNIKIEFNKSSTLQSSINSVINVNLDSFSNNEKIIGSRSKLKKLLDNLEKACECIEKVQDLEKEIASLETRKWKTETSEFTDVFGKKHTRKKKVLDQIVVDEINRRQKLLSEYESKADYYLT